MKPDPALSLQPAAAQLDDKTNQSGQALTIHKRRSFKENISERLASERTNANSDVECFPVARHAATIAPSQLYHATFPGLLLLLRRTCGSVEESQL